MAIQILRDEWEWIKTSLNWRNTKLKYKSVPAGCSSYFWPLTRFLPAPCGISSRSGKNCTFPKVWAGWSQYTQPNMQWLTVYYSNKQIKKQWSCDSNQLTFRAASSHRGRHRFIHKCRRTSWKKEWSTSSQTCAWNNLCFHKMRTIQTYRGLCWWKHRGTLGVFYL